MIAENIQRVREQIADACQKAGKTDDTLRLVAVTKTIETERINEALALGITDVGENRVQELSIKADLLLPRPTFHLIGHLQTNKVKNAVQYADFIHSVDSLHLAKEIQKQAFATGKTVQILLQVNTSGEESKFGVSPDGLFALTEGVLTFSNIRIRGLMTIAPKTDTAEETRPIFEKTRKLYERLSNEYFSSAPLDMLSMGMSNDFAQAILEGANVIRIGRSIFGERIYH